MRTSRLAGLAVVGLSLACRSAWAAHTAVGAVHIPGPCDNPQPVYMVEFGGTGHWSGPIENGVDSAAYLSEVAAYVFSEEGRGKFFGLLDAGEGREFTASLLMPARSMRFEDLRPEQVMLLQLAVVGEHPLERVRLTVERGLRLVQLTRDGRFIHLGELHR
jgi:hypothetical protein